MAGAYYFTDYCSGNLWQVRRDAAGKATVTRLDKVAGSISSFGEDEAGELYAVTDQPGTLWRLVPK